MKSVRMRLARQFLDVGVERPLDRGGVYELPEVVADSLIATGAADLVEEPKEAEAVTKDPKDERRPGPQRPDETKPARVPETKRGAA